MNIKDFKWTEKRFGTRFANILKRIAGDAEEGGKEIERHFTPEDNGNIQFKDINNNVHELVTSESFSTLLGNNSLNLVTWAELKDLRDNSELVPGTLYRITDYNCTTTQENTQSAGHQFDIVLLALSENKLAEEGWAMMHDNIYDVTFSDGVTKKCYIYEYVDEQDVINYNIVDVETKLGVTGVSVLELQVNEENKTASTEDWAFAELTEENLTYNYFQNSNLSAWKVWYCLDNDTARFAWADDSVDEGNLASITINEFADRVYLRDVSNDTILADINAYAWTTTYIFMGNEEVETMYTNSETPQIGDKTWNPKKQSFTGSEITSYTPAHEGTNLPNGRGVIYRLIDEFNNDVAYDFKNIQYIRPLTDGQYNDDDGDDTWCYTFTACDAGDSYRLFDASLGILYANDEQGVYSVQNMLIENIEGYAIGIMNNTAPIALSNNVFVCVVEEGEATYCYYATKLYGTRFCTFMYADKGICLNCFSRYFDDLGISNSIYINNRKVLTAT